jgi:hypothetical protein
VILFAFAVCGRACGKRDFSGELTCAAVIMAATLLNSCGLVSGGGSPATLPGTYSGQLTLKPPGNPIPETFFGMHIHHLASTTPWPNLSFGTLRLWDTYHTWKDSEPEKGKWNFASADKYLAAAEQHHVDVLWDLGKTPKWASSDLSLPYDGEAAPPRNLDDWREWVRTVATKYKGRVLAYEVWNEPNLKLFYAGSIPQLVQLTCEAYKTLKAVDPSILVSTPAFTGVGGLNMFDQFLRAGRGRCVDIIGYHLYVNPEPPEKMVPLIQQVLAIMAKNGVGNKQLWDTETGWANPKPFPTEELAAAYVARAYVLHWAAQVSRLYWYSWDNQKYGLQMTQRDDKTLKPAAVAYAEVQKWLVGARMTSCQLDSAQTWVCTLSREGGYTGWIVWNPNQTQKFELPRDWTATRMRDLHGSERGIPRKVPVDIGPSPILLE